MSMRNEPYNMGQSNKKDVSFPLIKLREKVSTSKFNKYKRFRLVEKKTTTGATYKVSHILDMRLYKIVILQIINKSATQTLFYKVDACIDPSEESNWKNLKAETSLAVSTPDYEALSEPWAFVRVQYKQNSGSGEIGIIAGCKSP